MMEGNNDTSCTILFSIRLVQRLYFYHCKDSVYNFSHDAFPETERALNQYKWLRYGPLWYIYWQPPPLSVNIFAKKCTQDSLSKNFPFFVNNKSESVFPFNLFAFSPSWHNPPSAWFLKDVFVYYTFHSLNFLLHIHTFKFVIHFLIHFIAS